MKSVGPGMAKISALVAKKKGVPKKPMMLKPPKMKLKFSQDKDQDGM
jgi:hypothetical protein